MAIEKYIAAAALALYVIFVMEIITLYHFMQEAPETLLRLILEPEPKILQFISIGVAPASIMSAVSFIMTRRYGSKPVGYIDNHGRLRTACWHAVYSAMQLGGVDDTYLTTSVLVLPLVLVAVSIPTIIVGTLLLRGKVRRLKKGYL